MAETLPAFDHPTPTADRRAQAWVKTLHRPITPYAERSGPVVLDPLDVVALQRKYGPERAHWPQRKEATFRVPMGVSPAIYERLRKQAIERWLVAMSSMGWEPVIDTDHPFRVVPGMYPAREPDWGNVALLDQREMIVRGWFRFRNPQPVELELPPHMLEPVTLRA